MPAMRNRQPISTISKTAVLYGLIRSDDSFFVELYALRLSPAQKVRRLELTLSTPSETQGEVEIVDCALFSVVSEQSFAHHKLMRPGHINSLTTTYTIDRGLENAYAAVLLRTPSQLTLPSLHFHCHIRASDGSDPGEGETIITNFKETSGKPEQKLGLFWAASSGWLTALKRLLDISGYAQGRINEADDQQRTLLSHAAECGHIDVVSYLLDHEGILVDQADLGGKTPLYLSADTGRYNITNVLLKKGARWDAADRRGRSPLHQAARNGHEAVVGMLLDHGMAQDEQQFRMDERDQDGQTPTSLAAEKGRKRTLQLLVKARSNVYEFGAYMKHYVLQASKNGWTELLEVLIEKNASIIIGSDVPYDPETGTTSLICAAAANGHASIVEILIDHGVSPNEKQSGNPALCLAVKAGYKEVVQALLDHGANATMTDSQYNSPKELANHDKEIWGMLLDRETEGRLAESSQSGDLAVDVLFKARVSSFVRKHGSEAYRPEVDTRLVWYLLHDPKLGKAMSRPEFRWIHLPANNVGHQIPNNCRHRVNVLQMQWVEVIVTIYPTLDRVLNSDSV
jgi:ankyrin repeat protein